MGYRILEYKEIWHYHGRRGKIFKEFILNIVKRKIECSGFPPNCISDESKENYVADLKKKCFIDLQVNDIKKDPAGHYLNKIMANFVWGNGLKILQVKVVCQCVELSESITKNY